MSKYSVTWMDYKGIWHRKVVDSDTNAGAKIQIIAKEGIGMRKISARLLSKYEKVWMNFK